MSHPDGVRDKSLCWSLPGEGGCPLSGLQWFRLNVEQCLLGHKHVFATSLPIDLAALKEIVHV